MADVAEAQKAAALQEIAKVLQLILNELRATRQVHERIAKNIQ